MSEDTYVERFGGGFVRRISKNDRVVHYRLSDRSLDRHRTRIEPDGIRTENYAKNPIFLWNHDGYGSLAGPPQMENIIGRSIEFGSVAVERGVGERAFDIGVEYAPKEINPRGELALRLVRGGFLNAVSIGAAVIEWEKEKPEKRGAPEVIVYTASELLEASNVAIPSNPNAVALAKSITSDYDLLDQFPEQLSEELERWLHKGAGNGAEAPGEDPPVDIASELGNRVLTALDREISATRALEIFDEASKRLVG